MLVGGALHGFYLRNEKQLLPVGRESESFDVSLVPGELLSLIHISPTAAVFRASAWSGMKPSAAITAASA